MDYFQQQINPHLPVDAGGFWRFRITPDETEFMTKESHRGGSEAQNV